MSMYKKLTKIAAVAALAFGLAACGGGDEEPMAMPEPEPTPQEICEGDGGRYNADMSCTSAAELVVEMEQNAIASAIAAAKAAADALTADSSTADVEAAQALAMAAREAITDAMHATAAETAASLAEVDMVDATIDTADQAVMARLDAEAAKADRAMMQTTDIMMAAGNVDTSNLMTQADIDAAVMAIAALKAAIASAVDVDDTSMYQTMVDNAEADVMTAQAAVNLANDQADQRMALAASNAALQGAIDALSGQPTRAEIDDVIAALAVHAAKIDEATDLPGNELTPHRVLRSQASAAITQAEKTLMAREDAEEKAEEDQRIADAAAMAIVATKLHAGISAPMGDANSPAATDRAAAYNNAGTPADAALDAFILVTIGDGTNTPTPVALSQDADAMVDAPHGWTGQMFTAEPDDDGTYEAVVYSDIEMPTVTMGLKFGSAADNDAYQYTLNAGDNTELTMDDTNADSGWAARVDSTSFDQDAGTKEFELPTNMFRVMIAGEYHGVPGTYYCTPAADSTCAADVAAEGFTLGGTANDTNAFTAGGGTWTFKPTNPEQKVEDTSADDGNYASYGWWIHKSEDESKFTASAFHDYKGEDTPAVDITGLHGTATYTGGAAGKYALRGQTGGTNDAGHFTADVTLEADFGAAHKISGTIDNFMGADGEARNWSVALNEAGIATNGGITGSATGVAIDADNAHVGTVWTVGGTAGAAGGSWSGMLREEGDNGVPAVATGTFHSLYGGDGGHDGVMVGAFGAKK